jgi:hypothetical protein
VLGFTYLNYVYIILIQDDLADKLGVLRQAVSKWETGFYYDTDLVGNEVGAASKKVIELQQEC